MSNFAFLQREWPDVYDAALRAESEVHADPRTSCFYARRALEIAIAWIYKHDDALRFPYQDNLSALIHEPTFKNNAGEVIFSKTRVINTLGNRAVHGNRTVPTEDAVVAVRELFHVCYWMARTYARRGAPAPGLAFDRDSLPQPHVVQKQTAEQLERLQTELHERDEKLTALLADQTSLDEELKRLRAEIAKAKKAAEATPDTHNYSEAETRDYFIDLLLREAGWSLSDERDREFEVSGMPNNKGKGYVDYVLWGDDGKPLALIEAKRTRRDPRAGQQQAKLYADCLEERFKQRPVIFYSNGYDHWIWDDVSYPPRAVQGFYRKDELELLIQRRTSRKPIATADIDDAIVERYYQTRAIRRVAEAFEQDRDRKALLVMATGSGKTRTVIALADLLVRCNWAKRVLFLADRVALVNQAVHAFRRHLPDSSPVNLVTERDAQGRVFVSTYPTMMGLIDEMQDGERRFGVGHFDLVIIDEAHRSVFQKYKAIFDYFDSLLVGLTATPKDELDRNTYGLFELENGVPTDAYSLEEAVADKFLVPFRAVSVPLRFQREGISYDDLSPDERDQWDALEWDEEGHVPDRVEAAAINAWLFNKDTVDRVLAHIMTRGIKVAGGDRLGKTIVFAKNQAHSEFIEERFNANYPHYRGEFARIITFKTEYAQSLIDSLSQKERAPHMAISVDMLDTGIDIPEVVNLVFFKIVRSKTKFWQMIGRGTRLSPDLFEPGKHKEFFYVFDYCGNLEYFSEDPPVVDGSAGQSLGKQLFTTRLDLLGELDRAPATTGAWKETAATYGGDPVNDRQVRSAVAERLHTEVAAMNVDNFIVRPKRRIVERYAKPESWVEVSAAERAELAQEVAGLPAELDAEAEEAKRFDLLMLRLQLARLNAAPGFEKMRDRVKDIAEILSEKSAIPMVREHLVLLEELQSDEWWEDVTVAMLEVARRRIRNLVQFIETQRRRPVYTDFEDEMGEESIISLGHISAGTDYAKFTDKARAFLRQHMDHVAIRKLRMNLPLTRSDLDELERMLVESGIGTRDDVALAGQESQGLGIFVRSLIGLDREAATAAMSAFLSGRNFSANQILFVKLVVDHLTEHGIMPAARLYESPFTDITPQGPEALFTGAELTELFGLIHGVRKNAVAA